jgi:hypothetical protein
VVQDVARSLRSELKVWVQNGRAKSYFGALDRTGMPTTKYEVLPRSTSLKVVMATGDKEKTSGQLNER